ncbi:MAG: argininosuccinate lyase [Betaproteobacteria bacterium]|nr:argininosuccinate lyase [Betaproteobacteria bacterium]MDH3436321.1 argininosuccinate lyase [Betaproteobacteria bacterium]
MSANDKPQNKPWSGRFSEPATELVQRFTASVSFDQRLAEYDVEGSLAHARMLRAVGVIGKDDLAGIEKGLTQIRTEIQSGTFPWSEAYEDVHLNIEQRLIELAGESGKRLHTARSRNDQVATDVRLFLREAIDHSLGLIKGLQRALLDVADAHAETVMPGFTHMQVAQPVSFSHHLMAYFEMFSRDAQRLTDCRKRVNRLPLGAAALAGTSFPIDRQAVARELGFDGICENSIDAVSDRDFAIEFCACATLVMMHLSRFCEELILWANPRFGFVELADRFCTGSSIMPQKKNPDVAELIRGKTGRVNGHLVALLTLMKAQPLAYNRDNQEDKEPLFDTVDTMTMCLAVFSELLPGIKVHREAMANAARQGHATATDLAEYLVRKGMPFREAHEAVSQAVRFAEGRGCELADLKLAELQEFAPAVDKDVFAALTLEGSLNSRTHIGGTAPARVKAAIAKARKSLA